jgi:hypothetical protein
MGGRDHSESNPLSLACAENTSPCPVLSLRGEKGEPRPPGERSPGQCQSWSGGPRVYHPNFAFVAHRTGSSLFRRAVTKKGKLPPRASGHGEAMRRARMKQDANAVKCQSFDGRSRFVIERFPLASMTWAVLVKAIAALSG